MLSREEHESLTVRERVEDGVASVSDMIRVAEWDFGRDKLKLLVPSRVMVKACVPLGLLDPSSFDMEIEPVREEVPFEWESDIDGSASLLD